MNSNGKNIDELPRLNILDTDVLVEVLQNGKNYSASAASLVQQLQTRQTVQSQLRWVNQPSVQASGNNANLSAALYFLDQNYAISATTLLIDVLQDSNLKRFDAITYDAQVQQYRIFKGTESANPITPVFPQNRYLLAGYVYVSANGVENNTPPPAHLQNTDTHLDFGGEHQVSAQSLSEALEQSHTQNTDQFLDEGGANEVSAADLRSLLNNPPSNSPVTASQAYILAFNTDLDTPNENRLIFQGKIQNITWLTDTDITSTNFYPQVSGMAEQGPFDKAGLQAWVDSSSMTANTIWYVRVIITPQASAQGEIIAKFSHTINAN